MSTTSNNLKTHVTCLKQQGPKGFRHFKGLLNGQNHYYQKAIPFNSDGDMYYYITIKKRQHSRLNPNVLESQGSFNTLDKTKGICEIEQKQSGNKQHKNMEKNYLILRVPLKEIESPFTYVSNSLRLSQENIRSQVKMRRINKLVCKAIISLMKQSNLELYTIENILFSPDEDKPELNVHLNLLSFAGMKLLQFNQQISVQEFKQIYELLGSNIISNNQKQRFTIQLKIRAIGMLFLCLLFEKRISLFNAQVRKMLESASGTFWKRSKKCVNKLKKLFKQLLEHPKIKTKIQEYDKQLSVRSMQFLHQVFVEEKQLKWSQVIEYLCNKTKAVIRPSYEPFIEKLQKNLNTDELKKSEIIDQQQYQKADQLGLFEWDQKHQITSIKMYITVLLAEASEDPELVLSCQRLEYFFVSDFQKEYNLRQNSRIVRILMIFDQLLPRVDNNIRQTIEISAQAGYHMVEPKQYLKKIQSIQGVPKTKHSTNGQNDQSQLPSFNYWQNIMREESLFNSPQIRAFRMQRIRQSSSGKQSQERSLSPKNRIAKIISSSSKELKKELLQLQKAQQLIQQPQEKQIQGISYESIFYQPFTTLTSKEGARKFISQNQRFSTIKQYTNLFK